MDSPTHALLGAVTAQLGFRQRIGRDATLVAAIAAYSPDLDSFVAPLISAAGNQRRLTSMVVHRGISHSLLMVPVIAFVFAGLWWLLRRRIGRGPPDLSDKGGPGRSRPRFGLLYACVFVAVLSHPLLDWLTSYGTQLLAPLTSARYAADSVAIIDFIYTPILILTLLACFIVRKVRPGRAVKATLIIGWVGFLLSVGYLAAGRVLHDVAVNKALALAGDQKALAADAYPIVGTIFLWRAVVETEDAWLVARIHHFANSARRPRLKRIPKIGPNQWVDRARQLPEHKLYEWFAMGRLRTAYAQSAGRHVVEFHDMRYAWSTDGEKSLWPLRVTFDASGELVGAERVMHGGGRSLRRFAGSVWRELWDP